MQESAEVGGNRKRSVPYFQVQQRLSPQLHLHSSQLQESYVAHLGLK